MSLVKPIAPTPLSLPSSAPLPHQELPLPQPIEAPPSNFRRVFQTTGQMKTEFVNFLTTIFYQLDEKAVLKKMEEILADPQKTDEEIYNELLANVDKMKKRFSPLLQIHALNVLKKGMGKQAAELTQGLKKEAFQDYLEVYNRRYLDVMRKTAGFALKGKTAAVADSAPTFFSLGEKIEAGALLSFYPYKEHIPLNDVDCEDPLTEPAKTHKPLEPDNQSLDLICCLGGLHHVPEERLDAFTASLYTRLRVGGVILLRDHDVGTNDLKAMVSLVHTFVNAADHVPWIAEKKEIRAFKTKDEWTAFMKAHGFTPLSSKFLVLEKDPTQNGMMAFVKAPQDLNELRQATSYVNDSTRPKDGTRATWIEWGNVRFSKQYAAFIQDHHAYAFDYLGHLRQHWQYFYHYIKESRADGVSLKNLIFSDNFAMNLFILFTTALQCAISYMGSLPSQLIARWKHGENWRDVAHLTDLEKYDAAVEKEYSSFIDHTPFYMFNYLGKIKGVWKNAKLSEFFTATLWTFGLLTKALISAPIRAIYTSSQNVEPDTVKILIEDPQNELDAITTRWENEKDQLHNNNQKIEVIYATPDGHKLVSVPRYRPFTQICGYFAQAQSLKLLEVGGQTGISVDVLLDENAPTPQVENARVIYEMEKLQDAEKKRYVTYQVALSALKNFIASVPAVEYIHE